MTTFANCGRTDRREWNASGFRPPLCTYRLNWARTTSWGWWDGWDDTALQTQDLKFEPWRSEAEHATSQSRRLSTILSFSPECLGKKHFCFFQTADREANLWNSGLKGSGAKGAIIQYPGGLEFLSKTNYLFQLGSEARWNFQIVLHVYIK